MHGAFYNAMSGNDIWPLLDSNCWTRLGFSHGALEQLYHFSDPSGMVRVESSGCKGLVKALQDLQTRSLVLKIALCSLEQLLQVDSISEPAATTRLAPYIDPVP